MTRLVRHAVTITTDASGDAIGYTEPVSGYVHQMRYVPHGSTPLATGADLDVTAETSGAVIANKDNIGTDAFTVLPRFATTDEQLAASLYAAAGEPVEDRVAVAQERIKVQIAQGGDTKTGTFHIYVEGSSS